MTKNQKAKNTNQEPKEINTSIVHCYVDNLIDNTDGKFDSFGSAWFKVSNDWLEAIVKNIGFTSLEEFHSTYTYDDSNGMLAKAIEDGVLLGCGTGNQDI